MPCAPPTPPQIPQDNRLTSILDSIIARVVERKIQERHAGCELSCPGPPNPPGTPGTPSSHCILAPGGLLWLQDPGHATNYRLFQEHWRQGQVSPFGDGDARTPPPQLFPYTDPRIPPPTARPGFRAGEEAGREAVGARILPPPRRGAGGGGGEPAGAAAARQDGQRAFLGRLRRQPE